MIDKILLKSKGLWIWAIVLIGFILCTIMPVFAQELPEARGGKEASIQQTSPIRPSLDASTIPAEKVSQFVDAYLQVLDLIEGQQPQLQATETELEYRRKQEEIQEQALAIIKQVGLTQQEYLQLLNLANIDPEFGERVATQLQEATN